MPATAPRTSSGPRLSAPLTSVYNGLDKMGLRASDNSLVNLGAPPDTTGAIGPSDYVETVNSIVADYNRTDLSLKTTSNLQAWLGTSASAPLCDPQMQWDASSARWLFVVLGCNFGVDTMHFGWSKTSNPSNFATGWCSFTFATTGFLGDYPKLGHSAGYMIIGTNDFADGGGHAFQSASIWWMPTPARGVSTCAAPSVKRAGTAGTPLTNGDGVTLAATPVPVNTITNASDGYVLAAYDPSAPSTESKLAIWHVDAAGNLVQDNDVAVTPYTIPNPAPNSGGSFPLDTLDGRLTQAVGDPVRGMWTQHTVGADTNPATRSRVDWYEVKVAGGIASLANQGSITSPTDFVFNAAISPTWDFSGVAVEYNRSSASLTPVVAAMSLLHRGSHEVLLASSTDGDHDFTCGLTPPAGGAPCRWGDYAGAAPDPANVKLVWGANQVLTARMSNFPEWATVIFALVVDPILPAQQSPATPGSRISPTQSSSTPPPPRP